MAADCVFITDTRNGMAEWKELTTEIPRLDKGKGTKARWCSYNPKAPMCVRAWGYFLPCAAFCNKNEWPSIDNVYRVHMRAALLTGMMKRITETINLDSVKKASHQTNPLLPSLASVTKTKTNRLIHVVIILWSIGSPNVLLFQIHCDDSRLL